MSTFQRIAERCAMAVFWLAGETGRIAGMRNENSFNRRIVTITAIVFSLTAFGFWLGYNIRWANERQAVLVAGKIKESSFDGAKPKPMPLGLRLIGERCHATLVFQLGATPDDEIRRWDRLFPEASIHCFACNGR